MIFRFQCSLRPLAIPVGRLGAQGLRENLPSTQNLSLKGAFSPLLRKPGMEGEQTDPQGAVIAAPVAPRVGIAGSIRAVQARVGGGRWSSNPIAARNWHLIFKEALSWKCLLVMSSRLRNP